jgi:hypothetical protein
METTTLKNKCLLLIATILLVGGNQPQSQPAKDYVYTTLNPVKGWEKNTPLFFSLDLTDTIHTCEIYFSAQIKNDRNLNNSNGFPVEVCLKSPGGVYYYNNVVLPINVTQTEGVYRLSHGIIEIEWPFIKNIKNKESGTWQITIKQTGNPNIYKNIIGFGACCKLAQNTNERKR